MKTFTEGPYYSFAEETTDALLDKENYLVALGTAAGTVKIATSTDDPIGVLTAKREGDPHVTVRLLGKGGTLKVIAGGVIGKNARVIWDTDGVVITKPTGAGSARTLGRKLSQGNCASGDIIEVLDVIEPLRVATVVAAPAAAVNVNGAIAGLNSTAVNPTKGDYDLLLAATETLADDVRSAITSLIAIHTALVAQGILAAP
jgi:hypothetical protein